MAKSAHCSEVISNAIYQHFKGGYYYVHDTGLDESTLKRRVWYQEIEDFSTGHHSFKNEQLGPKWDREASEWTEEVEELLTEKQKEKKKEPAMVLRYQFIGRIVKQGKFYQIGPA